MDRLRIFAIGLDAFTLELKTWNGWPAVAARHLVVAPAPGPMEPSMTETADLPDRRMQMVADKFELHELAMRYARAIDRRDRALLLGCYHPDAIDDHGTVFCGDPVEYADWAAADHGAVRGDGALHHEHALPRRWRRCRGRVVFRGLSPHDRAAGARDVVVGGRYLDRYQRRAGEWRIAHRTIAWDSARTTDCADVDISFLGTLGSLGSGTDDPSFGALPLLAGMG